MYDTFVGPFTAPYMQRALLELLIIAVPAGVLGGWVVVRRLAFTSHAVGHATFPALVIAALAGWGTLAPTVVAAVAIALVLGVAATRTELREGTAVAVVLSTSLALGALLVSDIDDPGISANSLLFGTIFAVTDAELVAAAIVAIVTTCLAVASHRRLVARGFDARLGSGGARRGWGDDLLLLVLLAVAIAVATRIAGSLLVSALFVIPAATVRLVVQRIAPLLTWAVVLTAAEGVVGLWAAATFDIPPGPCIAALASTTFVLVAVVVDVRRRLQLQTNPT